MAPRKGERPGVLLKKACAILGIRHWNNTRRAYHWNLKVGRYLMYLCWFWEYYNTKLLFFFRILLRWLGAFYIKRRIEPSTGSKDIIYRTALHTYMVQCLKAGHNIKFYIEGGRTRTGKSCLPKGIFSSFLFDVKLTKASNICQIPQKIATDSNVMREPQAR